jgi:hypothetical protein
MSQFPTLNFPLLLINFLIALYLPSVQAEEIESLVLNEDAEIDILHIGEFGKTALIWFACNQGEETAEFEAARNLVALGYQTFFPDMLSAHFLSATPSNIGKIPPHEVTRVIQHIIEESNAKEIYLVGGARAAIPVLTGLAEKDIKSEARIKGALLITPRINKLTPVPGSEPVYIDAVGQSQHPIRVLEGERTPNRWGLSLLKQRLAESGSTVGTTLIKGVRGFFYLRNDKTPEEEKATHNLPHIIDTNIQQLGASN